MRFLNLLFISLDHILLAAKVKKIEAVGDTYVAAVGLGGGNERPLDLSDCRTMLRGGDGGGAKKSYFEEVGTDSGGGMGDGGDFCPKLGGVSLRYTSKGRGRR